MALAMKADYALRAMVELAAEPEGILPTRQLADRTGVGYAFMTKIVSDLQRRRLAEVIRGNRGGVRISCDPRDITALQVVEAVSGPLELSQCVLDAASCSRSAFCAMRDMLIKAQEQLAETLSVDLRSLAKSQKRKSASAG